jgi:hypothetical protein
MLEISIALVMVALIAAYCFLQYLKFNEKPAKNTDNLEELSKRLTKIESDANARKLRETANGRN